MLDTDKLSGDLSAPWNYGAMETKISSDLSYMISEANLDLYNNKIKTMDFALFINNERTVDYSNSYKWWIKFSTDGGNTFYEGYDIDFYMGNIPAESNSFIMNTVISNLPLPEDGHLQLAYGLFYGDSELDKPNLAELAMKSPSIDLGYLSNGNRKENGTWEKGYFFKNISGNWKRCSFKRKINGSWKTGI